MHAHTRALYTRTHADALCVCATPPAWHRQIYDGDPTTLGLEVTVRLENVGTTIISEICYTRNVDPDQEQPWTDDYQTHNSIYYQPSNPFEPLDNTIDGNANPYDFAAVVARGARYPDLVQIMLTSHTHARAGYDDG